MLIELNEDGLEKQREIINILGAEELLSQLSEECCELGHAAQKMRRAIRGTTPVTVEEALQMLNEEIGDVFLVLDSLSILRLWDFNTALVSAQGKNQRWYKRTMEMENKEDLKNDG